MARKTKPFTDTEIKAEKSKDADYQTCSPFISALRSGLLIMQRFSLDSGLAVPCRR